VTGAVTGPVTSAVLTSVLPTLWIAAVMGWAWTMKHADSSRRSSIKDAPSNEPAGHPTTGLSAARKRNSMWFAAPLIGAAMLISPVAGVALATTALGIQRARRRRVVAEYSRRVLHEVGPLLDLVAISLSSGTNLDQALLTAARRGGILGALLSHELNRPESSIPTVIDALDRAVNRPGLRLGTTVTTAWHNGDPLVTVVTRLADDARLLRRRAAETHARRAPVRALGPLVLTTLPAFVLLTVVPLLASGLRELHLDPLR
jgi:Flp pilus assembly protein TadB